MFLGLIVFAILAAVAMTIALRAVRSLVRRLTGRDKEPEDKKDKKSSSKEEKKPSEGESKKEAKSAEAKPAPEEEEEAQETIPEETGNRYAMAVRVGIFEAFSPEESDFKIDEKALADECVQGSSLSYLEYNNRELAGDDFLGFNLIVEEGSRMVLTYGGSAVASMTVIERQSTAIINGETVTGTMPGYRINTFPPELKPGMVVGDLERMLEAAEHIRGLQGDPVLVSRAMSTFFTEPENIARLKGSIDRKIQSKESVNKSIEASRKQAQKGPGKQSGHRQSHK